MICEGNRREKWKTSIHGIYINQQHIKLREDLYTLRMNNLNVSTMVSL